MGKSKGTSYLTTISYRLFGRITSRFTFTAFKQIYQKSGTSGLFESYIALMFFIFSVVFASMFLVGALIHHFLFNLTLFQCFMAALIFSYITSLTVPITFVLYVLYRLGQRKKEIETNLVYTTGYMGVLAAGGIPIEKIFERMVQIERHTAIKDLSKKFITNIRMFGLDVISSLRDLILRSPSEALSKLLIGIANTVKTSGDLRGLLTFETKRLLHEKRENLKKTERTLIALGEIYIAAIVVGPIAFIIMLTILSIIGNVALGLSPVEQLNILVFFGLPAMSTVFILVLNSVLPEEE